MRYQNGKLNVIKRQKISFLGLQVLLTGWWNSKDIQNSRLNRSKNKLVRKNAVTGAHGSYSLQVMGSWPMAQVEKLVVEELQISRPKSLWKEGSMLNYSDVCEHSRSTTYRMAFASTRKAIRYVMNSNGPGVKRAAFTQVEHCAGAVGWEGLVH